MFLKNRLQTQTQHSSSDKNTPTVLRSPRAMEKVALYSTFSSAYPSINGASVACIVNRSLSQ